MVYSLIVALTTFNSFFHWYSDVFFLQLYQVATLTGLHGENAVWLAVEEFRQVQGPVPIPLHLTEEIHVSRRTWDQPRWPRNATQMNAVCNHTNGNKYSSLDSDLTANTGVVNSTDPSSVKKSFQNKFLLSSSIFNFSNKYPHLRFTVS